MRQQRCAVGERVGRQTDAGNDRAAAHARGAVDHSHGGGRAHVDDDERRLMDAQTGGGADDEVAGHRAGVVQPDVQPGLHAGADDDRVKSRDHADGRAQRAVDRWNDG